MLRLRTLLFPSIFVIIAIFLLFMTANQTAFAQEPPLPLVRQSNLAPPEPVSNTGNPAALRSERQQVAAAWASLPLSFEPNRGQTDPRVRFLSHAGVGTLWLTDSEAVLAVGRPSRSKGTPAAVLRMKFVGANATPLIAGEARQPGTVNYFAGAPDQWRTQIPTYAQVRYRSLYPGIDLVFHGNNRELEYDLIVGPSSDPGQIKLRISGAENLRLDADGNLVLKTAAGDVIQQKPKVYQRKGKTLVAVAADYVINGKNEVGFRLQSYDRRAAVVIDPVLRYASYLFGGGDENDSGTGIAVDSSNHAIVAGWTLSPEFPGETGTVLPGFAAFVTKFDFTGSKVIFSAFVIDDDVNGHNVALALDAASNIYLAGSTPGDAFSRPSFKPTQAAFQRTFGGGELDGWVAKFNSSGSKLIYATFLGGSGDDIPAGIAVDSSGNAYVTGSTTSKNFPVTAGVFQHECKLKADGSCASAFVTKLNADGSRALYSSYLGGHGSQSGEGIALNPSRNAFVVGKTNAKDFPTTAGTQQPAFAGAADAFIAQFSSTGSHLNYSTFLGGTGTDGGAAIALDSFGNAFVTGRTESTNFPVKNAFRPQCSGGCSFVSKLNTSGRLLYSTFIGNGSGTGIAVTPGGEAYVAGNAGTNFQTTQNAFQRVLFRDLFGNPPQSGIFITKLSATGRLSYSSYLGTAVGTPRVALDRSTNAYLTGNVSFGGIIPVTPGAFQVERGAEQDAFVAKVVGLCALSTVNRSVTICSPADGSTVKSPVRVIAGTTDVTPVRLTQVYLDGKKIYEARLSAINVGLTMSVGAHRLTVQAMDTANAIFKKTIFITVSPP